MNQQNIAHDLAKQVSDIVRRLQVKLIVNQAGHARAKGQVENVHNWVEANFERLELEAPRRALVLQKAAQ